MCFSAQVEEGYNTYVRKFGADISISDYFELYVFRHDGGRVKTSKAMDAMFTNATAGVEAQIRVLIESHDASEATRLETELFTQKQRLNKATRVLAEKPTKAAQEGERIATNKIDRAMAKLADLRRTELKPRDSRIFPGGYASVMVSDQGRRIVKPMRYQCRPAGKPASYDTRYPGTYNARRDNLGGFWRDVFGYSHAIMVVHRFFENVERIDEEGKPHNAVLEFVPADGSEMLVACLWSRWQGQGEPDLLSFAAITDEPPAEVAAAGHDRCIVPIKPENIDAWLNPDSSNLAALHAILEDRARPYYEHRMAA